MSEIHLHPILTKLTKSFSDKYRNGPEYLVLGGTQPTTAGDRFGTCAFRVTGPSDRVVQFGKSKFVHPYRTEFRFSCFIDDAVDLIESTIRFVLQGTYNKATGSVRFYDSGSGDVPCQDQKGIEGVDFVKVSYEVYRP